MINPITRDVASNTSTDAPVFNFYRYQRGATYHNTRTQIDFVTDGDNLYVCAAETVVTTAEHIEDQPNLVRIVSKGADGEIGATGAQGIPGRTPRITAKFDNGQVILYADGERIAATTDLTPPSWRPEVINNTIVWERTRSDKAPAPIDLNDLRAKDYKPLILRVDSDNTKRSDEESGPANFIQWKREGDEEWNNLIHISDLMNLALAGVSFWPDEDGYYHFGHRQVIHATYDSTPEGHRIISDVELGDVLFDAGKIPIANYSIDIRNIKDRLDAIENAIAGLDPDLSDYAKKNWVRSQGYITADDLSEYATKNWVEGKGYLTQHQSLAGYVKSVNGRGPDANGNVNVAGGGDIDLSNYVTKPEFNMHVATFDNLVANKFGIRLKISDGTDGLTEGYLYISFNSGRVGTWEVVGFVGGSGGSGGNVNWNDLKFTTEINNNVYKLKVKRGSADNDYVEIYSIDLSNFVSLDVFNAAIGQLNARIDGILDDSEFDIVTYRTFLLYQWSVGTPSGPGSATWNGQTNVLTYANTDWTQSPGNNPGGGKLLWMTSGTLKSDGTAIGANDWTDPVCLSGPSGQPGVDGKSVEFVYHLGPKTSVPTINYLRANKAGETPKSFANAATAATWWASYNSSIDWQPGDGTANGYWTDDPEGVSDNVNEQVEYAAVRTSYWDGTNNVSVWREFSAPFIWSMWGEDGVDGAGVEYIYRLDLLTSDNGNVVINSNTGEISLVDTAGGVYPPTAAYFEDDEFQVPAHYQHDDWVPGGIDPDASTGQTDEGWYSDTGWDRNWTDEPLNVTPAQPFQFVSIRKFRNGSWGPFSVPKLWNRYVTNGANGSYTSYIFTRTSTPNFENAALSNAVNPANIVTTLNGQTVNVVWEDTIPAGSAPVWMSYNIIGDNPDTGWTSPQKLGDSSRIQIEFSAEENAPTAYTLPNLNNYIDDANEHGVDETAFRRAAGLKDPSDLTSVVWGDEDDIASPIWMATAVRNGGSWTGWTYAKIKGETGARGQDGTSFAPIGTINALLSEYEGCTQTQSNWKSNMAAFNSSASVGTSILVTVFDENDIIDHTDMWVFTGENASVDDCANGLVYGWRNAGPLQGPAGESSYIHQKFANADPDHGTNCTVLGESAPVRLSFTPITLPTFTHVGELPGKYVGMYVDFEEADSENITKYTWAKWSGDDGFGMEQIFVLSPENVTPPAPVVHNQANTLYCNEVLMPDGSIVSTNIENVFYKYNVVPHMIDTTTNPDTIYTWQDRPITPQVNKPCWVSVRKLDNASMVEWSVPVIYDRYARDGQDSDFEESVYHLYDHQLTATELENVINQNHGSKNGQASSDRQQRDFLPGDNASNDNPTSFWTDNPQGIGPEPERKFEYRAIRKITYNANNEPTFGLFGIPTIWSQWGDKGRDGDGIEYVFFEVTHAQHILIQSLNNGKINVINKDDSDFVSPYIDLDDNNQPKDYEYDEEVYPYGKFKDTQNHYTYLQAADDYRGITDAKPWIYCAKRKYSGSEEKWLPFTDAVLWLGSDPTQNKIGNLSVSDDNLPIAVDENDVVTEAYESTSFRLGYVELRDQNGNLRPISSIEVNGVTFFTINNNEATITNNTVVLGPTSTGATGNKIGPHSGQVTISPSACGVSDHIYYTPYLKLVFTNNTIVNNKIMLTITVRNIDGYFASQIVTVSPVKNAVIVEEINKEISLIRKESEEAVVYTPNQIMINPYIARNNSLDAQKNLLVGFQFDDDPNRIVDIPLSYYIASDNAANSAFKVRVYDASSSTHSGATYSGGLSDVTLYFDGNGLRQNVETNAVLSVRFYNSDDNQRSYDDYSCYAKINLNKLGSNAVVKDNVRLRVGYYDAGIIRNDYSQFVTDETYIAVVYPGKNGDNGVNGSTPTELYCLGTESAYNATFNNAWTSTPGATIATLISNGWSVTYPTTTDMYNSVWAIKADIEVGKENMAQVWTVPYRKSKDGAIIVSYQYLDGKVMRMSNWTDAQLQYYAGNTSVGGIKYLDVVRYTSGNTTTYYKCINDVTYASNTKPSNPSSDSTHWAVYTAQPDSWFDTLLANSAYIGNLTSKQVVITDGNNIVAGMASGSDIAAASGNSTVGNIRIWAGAPTTTGDLRTAPFTVDKDGKLVSDDAEITGEIHAESGTIDGELTIGSQGSISSSFSTESASSSYTTSIEMSSGGIKQEVNYDDTASTLNKYVEIENGEINIYEGVSAGVESATSGAKLDNDRLLFQNEGGSIDIAVTSPMFMSANPLDFNPYPVWHVQVISGAIPQNADPTTIYFVL